MMKNLQRDYRDITGEIDKLGAGQSSQLSNPHEFQRATLRLREIVALLDARQNPSPLLASGDVKGGLNRLNTITISA